LQNTFKWVAFQQFTRHLLFLPTKYMRIPTCLALDTNLLLSLLTCQAVAVLVVHAS
jgi:hypothetical protein